MVYRGLKIENGKILVSTKILDNFTIYPMDFYINANITKLWIYFKYLPILMKKKYVK
jgi:hypothetical protein